MILNDSVKSKSKNEALSTKNATGGYRGDAFNIKYDKRYLSDAPGPNSLIYCPEYQLMGRIEDLEKIELEALLANLTTGKERQKAYNRTKKRELLYDKIMELRHKNNIK